MLRRTLVVGFNTVAFFFRGLRRTLHPVLNLPAVLSRAEYWIVFLACFIRWSLTPLPEDNAQPSPGNLAPDDPSVIHSISPGISPILGNQLNHQVEQPWDCLAFYSNSARIFAHWLHQCHFSSQSSAILCFESSSAFYLSLVAFSCT
jgi:hypothetical protein